MDKRFALKCIGGFLIGVWLPHGYAPVPITVLVVVGTCLVYCVVLDMIMDSFERDNG